MNLKGILILSFFFISFITGCTRTQPVDFKPGEYRCEFCQMEVVDLRFKAEILSSKGKVHRFDSIECMMGWWLKNPEEAASRWVTDFYHPEKWIPLERAYLLKSDRLASPMGASLSAYSSEEELQRALGEFGGRKMDLKELEFFIQNEWRKEIIHGQH